MISGRGLPDLSFFPRLEGFSVLSAVNWIERGNMKYPAHYRNGRLFSPFAVRPCIKTPGSFSNMSLICHIGPVTMKLTGMLRFIISEMTKFAKESNFINSSHLSHIGRR